MSTLSDQEKEELKRAIYEKIPPRRRKYIEKIGYDEWDPFQEPQDPIDIRMDATKRTTQQLVREFLQTRTMKEVGSEYQRGAWELCVGVMANSERHRGMFEFCIWYQDLLRREGALTDGPSKK